MRVDGKHVQFRSARDALAAGIGMVHQELSTIPDLTVAENDFVTILGRVCRVGGGGGVAKVEIKAGVGAEVWVGVWVGARRRPILSRQTASCFNTLIIDAISNPRFFWICSARILPSKE